MSEKDCGQHHNNVEEALDHVYENLVKGQKHLLPNPYWGKRAGHIGNLGKVIGWKSTDDLVRWRLDYDPAKGVHINEENFRDGRSDRVVHLIPISFIWAATYWKKWTSRFNKPPDVIEAENELLRRRRDGFR